MAAPAPCRVALLVCWFLAAVLLTGINTVQATTLAVRGHADIRVATAVESASPLIVPRDEETFFLEVTIPPESLLDAPSCQHTFSQIQLHNMVRIHPYVSIPLLSAAHSRYNTTAPHGYDANSLDPNHAGADGALTIRTYLQVAMQ
jgi:hypothetical protein